MEEPFNPWVQGGVMDKKTPPLLPTYSRRLMVFSHSGLQDWSLYLVVLKLVFKNILVRRF